MPNRIPINKTHRVLLILSVIFLLGLGSPGFSQSSASHNSIVLESQGIYPINNNSSKKLIKTMALFKAKRAAVELAGKYFGRKKLIEPYEHKKDEVYNILADEIGQDVLKEKLTASTPPKYVAKISVRIDVSDFIKAEILNLQYEQEEAKDSFRKKMEPPVSPDIKPGHDLAHAYRLIRRAQWRPAIIYLDRLETKYPDWDDIHLAKSLAYYALNELDAMQKALKKACRLGAAEACDDLEKIKQLHEHDFGL